MERAIALNGGQNMSGLVRVNDFGEDRTVVLGDAGVLLLLLLLAASGDRRRGEFRVQIAKFVKGA